MIMINKTKGSSLVVTLLVLAIVLISTLSIALVAIKDRQASIGSVNSSKAYQLADEGIEKVMQIIIYGNNNYINKSGEENLSDDLSIIDAFCDSATGLITDNGQGYAVELFDNSDPRVKINCNDSSRPVLDIDVIKSVGYDKNTSRAVSAPIYFMENGLIAYWKLNEDSGDVAYNWAKIGGDNDYLGQLSSGASFTGDAVDIPDGEFVQIEKLLDKPELITLVVWIKMDTLGISGSDVISLGNTVGIRVNDISNSSLTTGFYQGSSFNFTPSDTTISDSDWHMLVYTVDNDNNVQKMYIDGVPDGSSTSYSDKIDYRNEGDDTFLGKHGNSDPGYNFEGEMREVRVYDRVLSDDEILTLYNVSKP